MQENQDVAAVSATPAFAGFWRRLAAFAVDGIVLGIVGLILGSAWLPAPGPCDRGKRSFCASLVADHVGRVGRLKP